MYCYAEKVPETSSTVFVDSYVNNATLHVPDASIASYQSAAPWSGFKSIVKLVSLTGVYKVSVYAMKTGYEDSDVATAEFTMSGGGLKGDTNGDGKVDVEDVVETVNIILGEE